MNFGVYAFTVTWNPGGSTAYDALPAPNGPIRCTIQRGRSADLQAMEMGTCTLTVMDKSGVYNPANASSPLVSAGYLRPMRKLVVTITPSGGAATPIYTGFLSRAWADRAVDTVATTFEFVDGFKILNRAFPVVASTGITSAGTAIGLLLTASGITSAGDKDIDAGGLLPDFSADGTRSALQIIQEIQQVDQGVFFYSAAGRHTYRSRDALVGRARATPVATISAANVEMQVPGLDVDTVVNEQAAQVQRLVLTVNPDGTSSTSTVDLGALQTVTDTAYLGFTQAGTPIASVYLRDEAQANSLAQHVVATRKVADVPTRDVTLPGLTLASIQQQTALELANAVTLSGLGVSSEGRIESIRHEIMRQQHTTAYALTSRPGYGFTIGYSTIAGADTLVY